MEQVKWVSLFLFMISGALLLSMLPAIYYKQANPILVLVTLIVFGASGAVILPIFVRLLFSRRRMRKEIRRGREDVGTGPASGSES